MRYISDKSRCGWDMMSVQFVCLTFNVVIIYQYSPTSPHGIINYHFKWGIWGPNRLLTQSQRGSARASIQAKPFASKLHFLLCFCVFQTLLIGIYSTKTHFTRDQIQTHTIKIFSKNTYLYNMQFNLIYYILFYSISFCKI